MKVSFESKGGFENSLKWLSKTADNRPMSVINNIAKDGVNKLKSNTPKDTGETANGWESRVSETNTGVEVVWLNNAHPELSVNLAKLIELGHGTKNGGYVSPRPYIKQSMDSVLQSAGDKIAGEMFK